MAPNSAEHGATRHRVAIVGGGPSGFYAAEVLLRAGRFVAVDMFERLPVPYGLVRFGVAPDHPRLKHVTRVFDRIAAMPDFRFFGGVAIGTTISVGALKSCYHAVILATGASVSRLMGVPGETLPGSYQAGDFVAWYNGHPDFHDRRFDLSGECAVIIGNGNVALDIARMLAKTPAELRHTDIAAHALDALAGSRIREILIIGRGGPEQTRFAVKELQELAELTDCDALTCESDFSDRVASNSTETEEEEAFALLRRFSSGLASKARRCILRFGLTPVAIEGDGRVQRMLFRCPRCMDGGNIEIDCDLVFSSIGWRSEPICGIPYDGTRGIHANIDGRLAANGVALPGLYVSGWAKRGPRGTIGTNRGCSFDTVGHVLTDLPHLDDPPRHPDSLLTSCAGRHVDFAGWARIDAVEVARGQPNGKPREKIVLVDEMIAAACGHIAR